MKIKKMTKWYAIPARKNMVKEFFANGTWTEEDMTAIWAQGISGREYVFFGAKGNYGNLNDNEIYYVDSKSGRLVESLEDMAYIDIDEAINLKGCVYRIFK